METAETSQTNALEGKTALVTGGSRGIGRAISLALARAGVFVYINYRSNDAAADDTYRAITQAGFSAALLPFDVADRDQVHTGFKKIIDEKGTIDILINNAGTTRDGMFARVTEEDWRAVVDTNLTGTINCSRSALRSMIRARWGRIITISSIVAEGGNAGQVIYGAAKAGVIGLTKSLAREIGSRNITVNAVSPGFIDTDMTASLPAEYREELIGQIPLGRAGSPEDVAAVVRFLASNDAAYITGQTIRVNGGLYM